MKNLANHILVDYRNIKGNETEIGNFVFDLMIKVINETTMKIVHKKLVILNDNTPPGFTSVLLLDESHFTTHCYSELGLMMVDIATCGKTDTLNVIEKFNIKLKEKFPLMEITYLENHKRFIY
jgi:S-adenosylmethionine decarboxylase